MTEAVSSKPPRNLARRLEWTEPARPNSECPYDHVFAESTFGRYSIEWKSWKDVDGWMDDRTVACNGDFVSNGRDLEAAKAAAQADYNRRVEASLDEVLLNSQAWDFLEWLSATGTTVSTETWNSIKSKLKEVVQPHLKEPTQPQSLNVKGYEAAKAWSDRMLNSTANAPAVPDPSQPVAWLVAGYGAVETEAFALAYSKRTGAKVSPLYTTIQTPAVAKTPEELPIELEQPVAWHHTLHYAGPGCGCTQGSRGTASNLSGFLARILAQSIA